MKKLFVLLTALFVVSAASAQQTPSASSGMSRIWFGVAYTPKFLLAESVSVPGIVSGGRNSVVHNYALEAGYMLTSRLSLGLGLGYEREKTGFGAVDVLPLYVHGYYFYGKRRGGLFNYARIGTLIPADANARAGFTGGAGVGYRLMLCGRFGMDFKLGYDYSGATIKQNPWAPGNFEGADWSRHSLSLGLGLVF